MKKSILLLLLLCCGICSYAGKCTKEVQDEDDWDIYYPLDSVPDWLRQKTTAEEYAQWKRFSHYFKVNYAVFSWKMSPERKARLYEIIKKTCDEVENGTFPGKIGDLFTFTKPSDAETVLVPVYSTKQRIDENLSFNMLEAVAYTSEKIPGARIEFVVWFVYDKAKGEANIIKSEVRAAGPQVSFHGCDASGFTKERNVIYGSFAGLLKGCDAEGTLVEESLYKTFEIALR